MEIRAGPRAVDDLGVWRGTGPSGFSTSIASELWNQKFHKRLSLPTRALAEEQSNSSGASTYCAARRSNG